MQDVPGKILGISLRLYCVINRENVCEYVCFTGKEELTSADPNLITIYTERKSYNFNLCKIVKGSINNPVNQNITI